MKTYLLILSAVIILLSSCNKDETSTKSQNTLKNISSHDIKIIVNYYSDNDTILLPKGESIHYNYINLKESNPYPFDGYSMTIYYNDTIHITHYKTDIQPVSRNIYFDINWVFSPIDAYEFYYEYVFTDEDYQEALDKM